MEIDRGCIDMNKVHIRYI